ncbi:hypothetical protein NDU88_003821 [Pleurodeles waltl]|uniref:Uncharacterized protein n=1 Tax=Pleurodeles waltl TaxID=8319 RepID=A0AAV7MUJ9_PLEWA|nr:hypothetical protein NDU88_003821 [Pleurodeles waltl]
MIGWGASVRAGSPGAQSMGSLELQGWLKGNASQSRQRVSQKSVEGLQLLTRLPVVLCAPPRGVIILSNPEVAPASRMEAMALGLPLRRALRPLLEQRPSCRAEGRMVRW